MNAPFPATARQQDVLRFVHGFQLANDGASPSFRQIADAIGSNKTSVYQLLRCLEDRGLIRRLFNRDRAIEVLHPPRIPFAPDGAPLFAVPLDAGALPC